VFAAHTVLLPCIGIADFASYDDFKVAGCRSGGDDCYEWAEVDIETPFGPEAVYTMRGSAQTPAVPWQLLWYLDWGWFLLLGMTVIFLPDSPALEVKYTLTKGSAIDVDKPSAALL